MQFEKVQFSACYTHVWYKTWSSILVPGAKSRSLSPGFYFPMSAVVIIESQITLELSVLWPAIHQNASVGPLSLKEDIQLLESRLKDTMTGGFNFQH